MKIAFLFLTLLQVVCQAQTTTGTGTQMALATAVTGSGGMVLQSSPTLITPALGVATVTSINGDAITAGTGTLTLGSTTLTISHNVTFDSDGTGTRSLNIGAGGTLGTLAFQSGTLTSGTVTSVSETVPAFLSISGSPITSSGTIGITLSGTALPVVNGGTGITSFGTGVASAMGNNTQGASGFMALDGSGNAAIVNGTLAFTTAGTGIVGGATATRPTAGNVGSLFNVLIASSGSTVSLSTGTAKTVLSQAVSAGHYNVCYKSNFTLTGNTMLASNPITVGISTTNNTLPTDGSEGYTPFTVTVGSTSVSGSTCCTDVVLTGSGTIYAVAKATFSAGTVAGYGELLIYQLP